jgi:O-antigen biosynthesis protein WbqV
MTKTVLRRINLTYVAMLHDVIMVAASFMLALYLRLGDDLFGYVLPNMWLSMVVFTVIAMATFITVRLYRGLWRFASVQDLLALTKAATIAIGLFYLSVFLYNRLEAMPRSIPMIHWMVLLVLLGGPRFAYRITKDRLVGRRFTLREDRRIPVLLVGANDNTEHFLRDTERNANAVYRVVGVIVDDARMHGKNMHGVPIYNALHDVPFIARKLARRGDKPQRIIVADDSIEGADMRDLLNQANEIGMTLARLPKLTEFKSGLAEGNDIRPIAVEDLLGRAQNAQDKTAMRDLIAGKRVMVTGAGGTIGSELVRQIASFGPASIYLFEQSEFNLYQIDMELAETFPAISRKPLLGDVRDTTYIDHIFGKLKPEVVFHSAAIKHVPMAEYNPEEAILTNVIGTRNIADACVEHKVLAMVLISTDKAVNPANVMGATKRLAECYCQALGSDAMARGDTRFITVRFGNVLGSTGSVVPLFQKQLKRGGPITITHPDMVRYFMTVREAVELVLQAAAMGAKPEELRHGLIFVVDMGQPVRIEELAMQMIRLAGFKPHKDIQIVYTGLRPGEKLYEELFHNSETSLKTDHEGILLASSRKVELQQLQQPLVNLQHACIERKLDKTYAELRKLVPEFNGSDAPDEATSATSQTRSEAINASAVAIKPKPQKKKSA